MKLRQLFIIKTLIVCFLIAVYMFTQLFAMPVSQAVASETSWWEIQSIDTMKYSRDPSREKLGDPNFGLIIDQEVKNIAKTGATHVGVGTPYDEEFYPILRQWVAAARKHNLNVWFRGNFSGWEHWFGYSGITRNEHTHKLDIFIRNHPDLFADGDIFSSCPECENGGPGDPRRTGDTQGFRQFIITQYQTAKTAFTAIKKDVRANFFSMNGDVARLIMDRETTAALDGIVVVDHYVQTPEKLQKDIVDLAQKSGGKIVLGEFGAPIPDIHGKLSEQQQADWIAQALSLLANTPELIGVNYWVDRGGSTQLWNENGTARKAVETLTTFYTPAYIAGTITDEIKSPISNVIVMVGPKTAQTDKYGKFLIPVQQSQQNMTVESQNYEAKTVNLDNVKPEISVTLVPKHETFWYLVKKLFLKLLGRV